MGSCNNSPFDFLNSSDYKCNKIINPTKIRISFDKEFIYIDGVKNGLLKEIKGSIITYNTLGDDPI